MKPNRNYQLTPVRAVVSNEENFQQLCPREEWLKLKNHVEINHGNAGGVLSFFIMIKKWCYINATTVIAVIWCVLVGNPTSPLKQVAIFLKNDIGISSLVLPLSKQLFSNSFDRKILRTVEKKQSKRVIREMTIIIMWKIATRFGFRYFTLFLPF